MTTSSLSARIRRTLIMAALLCGVSPAAARADGLFIPYIGWNFGGDAGGEFSDAVDSSRLNWGASLAWMGGGVIGFEGDFGYSPDFFGKTDLGGSKVFTAFGNVMLGVPFGGQKGFGIRPYGVVGIGLVYAEGEAFETAGRELNENKIGWDFGGGVMMFFTSHVGIRGDIRYFRTFQALDVLDIEIENGPGDLDFTRGSVGFVVRF
ncbi:MAG TPA: outer membrane beta-barrel protein [Vicinamibacterales bacterium]|nr:outer membrane beta-barrel protein [Vicinamibacterales bacterium]